VVAGGDRIHVPTNGVNPSGAFVPHNERKRLVQVPVCDRDIGMTEARSSDLDENLLTGGFGHLNRLETYGGCLGKVVRIGRTVEYRSSRSHTVW
jgi:hypothetical protein